ncbi:alpha-galactosidase [Candidatus Thorarchaeota archaeon]|nr:MAG: alpha-galactosidase [Candidatus Thorarchaeota archaeon]
MPDDNKPCQLEVTEEGIRLSNSDVTIFFDTQLGLLMLTSSDEKEMCFSRGYIQIHTERAVYDSRKMIYKSLSTLDFTDQRGEGKAVVIRLQNADRTAEIHLKLSITKGYSGYSSVVQFKNRSGEPVRVDSIDPFVIDVDDATRVYTGWKSEHLRFFKNGYHSWELSQASEIADGRNVSHYYSVIHNVENSNSLALGFVTLADQHPRIMFFGREEENKRLAQIAASCSTDGVTVNSNDTLMSEELLVTVGKDPSVSLDRYITVLAKRMMAIGWDSIPTGWCSWYFYYVMPDEDEVIKNIEFLQGRFPGIDWIQLDDGYQKAVGDWEENDRFSSGLSKIVNEAEEAGYRAGIWTAPFVASEHSEIFKDKPDWFVRDDDNQPIPVDENPLWLGKYYALDLTNPLVLDFIEILFKTLKEDGFEYFKIDFLYHAAVQGRRHDDGLTGTQALRQGLERIRESVGDSLVLGCGAPLGPCIGLVNMMRIGTDIATDWRLEWGGGVYECSINTMTRANLHNKLWINDPDCILVRQDDNNLTLDEVRLWLSIVAVSGGAVLLSDRMMEVNEERLALIDKILPPMKRGGFCPDALYEAEPRIFAMPVDCPMGQWSLVAVVNLTERNQDIEFSLPEIGRDEQIPCHIFEFWEQAYEGQTEDIVCIDGLKPHACKLLIVKPEAPTPCVLSTSMHFSQGAVELKDQDWDPSQNELSVVVDRTTHVPESIFFVFSNEWEPLDAMVDSRKVETEKIAPEVIGVTAVFEAGQEIRVRFERL